MQSNTSNKSWNEWSQHVLAELIRLNNYCEKMEFRLTEIEKDFGKHEISCPIKSEVFQLTMNVNTLTEGLHETCESMKTLGGIVKQLTEQVKMAEARAITSRKWLNRLVFPLITAYIILLTYLAIIHATDILKLF